MIWHCSIFFFYIKRKIFRILLGLDGIWVILLVFFGCRGFVFFISGLFWFSLACYIQKKYLQDSFKTLWDSLKIKQIRPAIFFMISFQIQKAKLPEFFRDF